VEGSGKSTQILALKEYLEKNGHSVLLTRQPGGSILGTKIRHLILDPEQEDKPADITELLLYIADWAHHVSTVIEPALRNNIVVLCDRYTDSTVAYQGYARGFDLEQLDYLNNFATKSLKPDLTIVMDLQPSVGLTRIKKNRNQLVFDRIEAEKIEFHQKVREGFIQIARKETARVKLIDASQASEEITKRVISLIEELLLK